MKRFHVHVAVDRFEESIRFYSSIFGTEPAVVKPDYAKWMLDDPRLNFAISRRGHPQGVNHLGFQVESDEELKVMRARLEAADAGLVEQTGTACCYARSDKYWVTDPSGIAWETFHTLGALQVYGEDRQGAGEQPCCVPQTGSSDMTNKGACCAPKPSQEAETGKGCCA